MGIRRSGQRQKTVYTNTTGTPPPRLRGAKKPNHAPTETAIHPWTAVVMSGLVITPTSIGTLPSDHQPVKVSGKFTY